MAEAIVSTLKAKIKANDEELQMFQDKWANHYKANCYFVIAIVISIIHIIITAVSLFVDILVDLDKSWIRSSESAVNQM